MTGRLARACEQLTASTALQPVAGETTGGYRAVGAAVCSTGGAVSSTGEAVGSAGGAVGRAVSRSGALLVVLPGIVGPADALAALALELGDGWRVCFVTYPRLPSLEALVAWLEALRAREGGAVASLWGGSFGGLVAQAWLRAQPQAIGDVVLSGTGPPEPARAKRNARALPWLRRLPMPAWRGLLRVGVRRSTTRSPDRAYWRRFYGNAIGALVWADLESRYRVAIGIDAGGAPGPAVLQSWPGRLLVIEGSRDRVAHTTARAALRGTYARAAVHVVEGASHAVALERPDEWLSAVSTFYRG